MTLEPCSLCGDIVSSRLSEASSTVRDYDGRHKLSEGLDLLDLLGNELGEALLEGLEAKGVRG